MVPSMELHTYPLPLSAMVTPLSHFPQLLFLILTFFTHLCPCSQSSVNITHLPGFAGALPFRLETGYVNTDAESGAELFYYFTESERNPSEDPLILWLTGGPGCSGFNGLALAMGPLKFQTDDFDGSLPTLVSNPHAWTKIASMIFLDWPFGTGFSYSRTDTDYITEDWHAIQLIYKFLKMWLLDHPFFLTNPFYMGGESYGGKMATLVAHEIVQGNEKGQQPLVNIKGYLIGNAITGEKVDKNTQAPHAYGLGLIPEEFYKLLENSCADEDFLNPETALCAAYLKIFRNKYLAGINIFGILEPTCNANPPTSEETFESPRSLEEKHSENICKPSSLDPNCISGGFLSNCWSNNPLVRQALHVKEGSVGQWYLCDFDVNTYRYNRSIPSSVPYHRNLTSRGYRALVYSGDHDMQVPFLGSLKWIKSLDYPILDPWRAWHVNNQVAGFTILFSNNLTFATVKGGNHITPGNRPAECFGMFKKWISHEVL